MPRAQSVETSRRGEFRRIYRALVREPALRARTPVIFCEGDSWFSTPLAMNLLDWLVFPSAQTEATGVPLVGRGGLFFRAEDSGDMAVDIFAPRPLADIMDWYEGFDFDLALLSAGGNDFVAKFLEKTFAGQTQPMSPDAAYRRVLDTGRFGQVHRAYERALLRMVKARPDTPILAHTYCYPIRLGVPATLTLATLGAAALLKKNTGPWIEPHIRKVLPDADDQRAFARLLIDGFVDTVLDPLRDDARFAGRFDYVDLRAFAQHEDDWFDEMHPTSETFAVLAAQFSRKIDTVLRLPPT